MFDNFVEKLINGIIYVATVAIAFAVTSYLVMLVSAPLVALSYVQSISATLLTFIFFQIGSLSFDTGDDEY